MWCLETSWCMPQILTQNLKTHSKFWKLAQIFGVVVLTTNFALRKCRIWNLAQTPRKNLKTHEASTSPQCDVYYKIMRCCTKIDKDWVCLEIHLNFDRIFGQRKHFWGQRLLEENYLELVFNITYFTLYLLANVHIWCLNTNMVSQQDQATEGLPCATFEGYHCVIFSILSSDTV